MYFVDNRQALHFKQLFATAEKAWLQSPTTQAPTHSSTYAPTCDFTHAANGFVSLPEGAMSTRHGRVIFLSDLVDESFDRVKAILLERGKTL
jgi:arginyl-tRNA synthetase